jgi:DNA-binding MarR family transcriptional regulator
LRRQPKERLIPAKPKIAAEASPVTPPSASDGKFALGKLDHLLVFRFRRLRDFIIDRFRTSITDAMGLKAGDFTILALIEANPSISQTDLARTGGFDQAVLVGILDDLEGRGWAVRRKDKADRRRHRLEITPEGSAALSELFLRAMENEAAARAALTTKEYEALDRALSKMYQHVF